VDRTDTGDGADSVSAGGVEATSGWAGAGVGVGVLVGVVVDVLGVVVDASGSVYC
jgi:hypothetical protein